MAKKNMMQLTSTWLGYVIVCISIMEALSGCSETSSHLSRKSEIVDAFDGIGTEARFNNPGGIVIDKSGNLYVADSNNSTIRKITPFGIVSTFAGKAGATGFNDGQGGEARFDHPSAVAIDRDDNLYVADSLNDLIRKITPAGEVSTIAGKPGSRKDPALIATHGNHDGTRATAQFDYPDGIAVDVRGNLYVLTADLVRKITPSGAVSTIAGHSISDAHEEMDMSRDGPATSVRLGSLGGIAVDQSGVLYVTTSNGTVKKITPDGRVTTIAGKAMQVESDGAIRNIGSEDGKGSTARFHTPWGIAIDSNGTLYVADRQNHSIRKILLDGTVSTVAVSAVSSGSFNGKDSAAHFVAPTGITIDSVGNLFVTDPGAQNIRKVNSQGIVTTIAGPENFDIDVHGNVLTTDRVNPPQVSSPAGASVQSR
jgi:sugar lactone lactonase YvrE